MLCSKRPVRALFVGVFLALAATASAQSFPAGLVGVADSQAGQLSLPPVTAGGQNPLDRASGEAALERRRQRANGDGSLLGDIARDYRSFFTTRETYRILAQGLGIALVLRPLDEPITTNRFNGELWENRALDRTFEGGEMLGGALLQVGGAFVTYGVGKVAGKPRLAELGRDLVRVQMLTQGVTQVIKYSVRRSRPDGSSNSSFPSGHTSGSFATATVLQRHYGWKAGVPAFGVASYIAASRLSENKHFLSDIAFGTAIGLAAGRTVTFDRGSTRFEIAPMAAPGGAGVQMRVFTR